MFSGCVQLLWFDIAYHTISIAKALITTFIHLHWMDPDLRDTRPRDADAEFQQGPESLK